MVEKKLKKIIHIDMDYFYAQVELLAKPHLANKPVAIGGSDGGRGVICTCNYVARKYGVKSAMPSFKAKKLCPELIFIQPNFKKYKNMSAEIFEIFTEYTDLIEGVSLDEAYLDVTDCGQFYNSATYIASDIRKKIYEKTGLTASAGVSYNKLLAKIASDYNKPNALFVLGPYLETKKFIKNLNIAQMHGVGKVTQEKMSSLGVENFSDLQKYTKLDLINLFGSFGAKLYDYARGYDDRDVKGHRERKSLSVERTFSTNMIEHDQIKMELFNCYEEMMKRLTKCTHRTIKSFFVKIKFADFTSTTVETQYESNLDFNEFYFLCIKRLNERSEPIRLIGSGVRFMPQEDLFQLNLPLATAS